MSTSRSQLLTVALAWPAEDTEVQRYNDYLGGDAVVVAPRSGEPGELVEVAREADVLMGNYVPRAMLDAAKNARMVQILHSGMAASRPDDQDLGFPLELLEERGIWLSNMHGNRFGVAEHAFALMLAFAKQLFPAHRAMSQGDWLPFDESHMSVMLNASTLTLVGVGAIGTEIARRADAFDMRVLAVRRDPAAPVPEDLPVERVYGMDGLTEALAQADFVIIACPLTAETYRLFGETELRAMKPSAYLINIARAAIVEEQAVYRALTENWIRGFASDVWWLYGYDGGDDPAAGLVNLFGYHYALPSRLGVHKLPNVIATGDRASFARETLENFILDALDNIRMLARGQRLRNLVDIKRRY